MKCNLYHSHVVLFFFLYKHFWFWSMWNFLSKFHFEFAVIKDLQKSWLGSCAGQWVAWQPCTDDCRSLEPGLEYVIKVCWDLQQNNLKPADCQVVWCLFISTFPQSWWLSKLDVDLEKQLKNKRWSVNTKWKEISSPLFGCMRNYHSNA